MLPSKLHSPLYNKPNQFDSLKLLFFLIQFYIFLQVLWSFLQGILISFSFLLLLHLLLSSLSLWFFSHIFYYQQFKKIIWMLSNLFFLGQHHKILRKILSIFLPFLLWKHALSRTLRLFSIIFLLSICLSMYLLLSQYAHSI